MQQISTDVLVIGGGLAGSLAALEAERLGLNVLLVGKFAIGMGTNTSLAMGAFAAARSDLSKEDHLRITLDCGRGLNHLPLVKILVEKGPEAIEKIRESGVSLTETANGIHVARPEESSQLPGVLLVRGLLERLRKSSVRLLPGLVVFDLVVEEGEVRGAFGFFRDGSSCLVRSRTVILAAGGAGAVYARSDNQRSILGDGYALALRAGLAVFDLEFVQFYPLVLAEPRLSSLILLPPYPEEMKLVNEKGEDLLEKFEIGEDLNRAVVTQRDRISIALYEASRRGDIYMDLTRSPSERWERFPLNFLRKSRFLFRERPFLVAPAAHFCMGGLEVSENGATPLPGLFAAGEAVWGLHGANRLGGNALTECAVFGLMAGRSAGEESLQRPPVALPSEDAPDSLSRKWARRAREYTKQKRGIFDPPRDLLKELKTLAWKCLGPVREEHLLNEGQERLKKIEERIQRVSPATVNDLFKKRELENVVLFLKAILQGSLIRGESRGAFSRRDFPEQDDLNWLKNSRYQLRDCEVQVTHRPVSPPE
jgi:succinate dehydrogenase/fumarate reductase flavoprotein subunit